MELTAESEAKTRDKKAKGPFYDELIKRGQHAALGEVVNELSLNGR